MDEDELTPGSGNVFADIGIPNADEHRLKADLALRIVDIMRERGLTQTATAKILGITQPEVSNIFRRGQFERVSVERLLGHLVRLGHDVEIVVRPLPLEGEAGIKVVVAAS